MPKRTNKFQQLVVRMYKQMADPGDLVTESAMLTERNGTTKREVDILLEKKIFGTRVRLAVECRNRGDKDDVTWIDSLIGKYKDLDLDRKIAVSSSGFSRAAQDKANLNRIELFTLRQALETDWPAEFVRLGMALVARNDRPAALHIVTDPPVSGPLSLNMMMVAESGKQIGTIEQIARTVYERRRQKIDAEIGKQFLAFFKTLSDLAKHKVIVDISQSPTNQVFIEDSQGTRYRLVSFILRMVCSFSYKPITLEHYLLGVAQVSAGSFSGNQTHKSISFTTIQVPARPKQVNVHWECRPKAKKREGKKVFA